MILPVHALSLLLALGATGGLVVDRVVATVNGDPVTLAEVQDRAGNPEGLDAKARAKALKNALEQIVDEKLFESQAAALQVEVSEAQVDAAVNDVKKRNHFETDAQLDQALREQRMTRADFRKMVRHNLEAFEILRAKVSTRVKVTDEDLRNYYQHHAEEFAADDEVHVRHIFLALPKKAAPAEEARIQGLGQRVLKRVTSGEDFAKVAREVSQGPSAAEGGDLGFLKRGTVQPELEQIAFSLKTGEISGLIRTSAGFQILKAEGRRGGEPRPFDQVKDEIRDRLTNEQLQAYRTQYISELRKDAVIEVLIPELR